MTFTISKDFQFSASHQLAGLPDGHPCGRMHGHNYTVRVELAGETLDAVGMVLDYGALRPFGAWIDDELDHRHLNQTTGSNPTAEHLAECLHDVLHATVAIPDGVRVAVGVSETPKTWAWFRPGSS